MKVKSADNSADTFFIKEINDMTTMKLLRLSDFYYKSPPTLIKRRADEGTSLRKLFAPCINSTWRFI